MASGLIENFYVALAPQLLPIIEAVLVVAVVALTLFSRRAVPPFLPIEGRFSRLAREKTLAIVLVGAGTLLIRLAITPVWGVPLAAWHDEFSYLLAADTFAHGRLTNPTHPMWIHFEGFHIIQHPTYMSMYPPGQGLILAAGQLLGHPWIGQLLTTALMCSCLCWMLQAWLPPRWALLGACLGALHFAILSYWMNSYFGTSLPALGGILILGALPRIKRRASVRDSLLMALGLAILANTRPFEGLVFSLPVAAALLVWMFKQKRIPASAVLLRVGLPIALVLVVTAIAMGYYFWRVTGDVFVMPYQVNRQTYAVAPYFVWETPRAEPLYHHAEMRDFYINWELRSYEDGRSISGYVRRLRRRAGTLWAFFVGPVFTLPFLLFPWIIRDRKMKWPLIIAGTVIAGNLLEVWTLIHYFAPVLGLFVLLLVQSIRHLRTYRWRGRAVGQGLARALPMICIAMVVLRVTVMAAGIRIELTRPPRNQRRHEIELELRKMTGQQLVIVHYSPNHIPHEDWIANEANIDASKIVWARDMGANQNRELLNYFSKRQAWLVQADDQNPKPVPYPPS